MMASPFGRVAWLLLITFYRGSGRKCGTIIFDEVDANLKIRTSVLEDDERQRYLVLTDKVNNTPCSGWIDGECQGVVQCDTYVDELALAETASPCQLSRCNVNPSDIRHAYVRTMLASAALRPRNQLRSPRRQRNFLELKDAFSWQSRAPKQGARFLVIGLGSSTMAIWLRKRMPHATIHVVELVPAVVSAASCFGLDTSDSMLHLHAGDGREYLQRSADGFYDGVLVDAFDPDSESEYPTCMRTTNFFALAKRKLAPGGVLSLNLWKEGEYAMSRRILKSMYSAFDGDTIWHGSSAEMDSQEVVVAFVEGGKGSDAVEAPADAMEWFSAANFARVDAQAFSHVTPFLDEDTC